MKLKRWYVLILLLLVLPFVTWVGTLLFQEYTDSSMPTGEEKMRQVSRDGLHVAILLLPRKDGAMGATISQPYQVWIQALIGAQEKRVILRADRTNWIAFSWLSNSMLLVCYKDAQVNFFRNNFVIASKVSDTVVLDKVEVELRKVSSDGVCEK